MHYDEIVYRPPQEAFTPLLQVTSGCSYNKCTFCNMYENVSFRISPIEEIEEDLAELQSCDPNFKRIYLINGDPFVLSMNRLENICQLIHKYLPKIKTISTYASIKNISLKSLEDLKKLRSLGMDELYIGLESGSYKVLKAINKGNTAEEAFRELSKLEKAGIKYNTIIMTGLGGKGNGVETALETAKLFNKLKPRGIFCTSTIVMPNTKLHEQKIKGEFIEASEYERVLEVKTLIENINIDGNVIFNTTHPSNNLLLNGVLPKDREILLQKCNEILENYTEAEFQKTYDRSNLNRM